jgi:threonylcarbamoyladenosine tRNA methylthiotransferase MtaB
MPSIIFVTVGCKLNRFETEQMREAAELEGYVCRPDREGRFDICVVNTCTVTSKSDYRSRQAVRRAVRANPGARVVVTGCYAQRFPEELAAIRGVDAVIGNKEKHDIARYLANSKTRTPLVQTAPAETFRGLPADLRLHRFGDFTRAFVKIQDGCDNRCSYCAVPHARGRSRSKGSDEVLAELEILADEGFREIVLTGVHLGSYGRDLEQPTSLVELLEKTARVAGLERVRLSSIEPTDFSPALIEAVSDPALRVCPHFHVPLQSGDDGILRRMGRPYTSARYADTVRNLALAAGTCSIGADVMVGFPGEDERAFENTRRLVADLPLTYLHVFAFSRRRGTPAASLENAVEASVKKTRSRTLREMGASKSAAFRASLEGKVLEVLILARKAGDLTLGLSGNYVKTYLEGRQTRGRIVPVKVTGPCMDGVLGEPQGRSAKP